MAVTCNILVSADILVAIGCRIARDMLVAVDGGVSGYRLVAGDILTTCDSLAASYCL